MLSGEAIIFQNEAHDIFKNIINASSAKKSSKTKDGDEYARKSHREDPLLGQLGAAGGHGRLSLGKCFPDGGRVRGRGSQFQPDL